jgi:hypothetical protein
VVLSIAVAANTVATDIAGTMGPRAADPMARIYLDIQDRIKTSLLLGYGQ